MKAASLFLLLGLSELLRSALTDSTVSLNVIPNRQQFFEAESVSLSCEQGSSGWKVKRRRGGEPEECGGGGRPEEGGGGVRPEEGGGADGSSCSLSVSTADSGLYWCETAEGDRSPEVHITASGGSVILDIPALPVMEGSDVTLHCRTKSSSNNTYVHFIMNDTPIGPVRGRQLTISNVDQSDAGSYSCYTTSDGRSPGSQLSVRARPTAAPPTTSRGSAPVSSPSASFLPSPQAPPFLLQTLLGALLCVVLLVLLLVGALLFRRRRAGQVTYGKVVFKPQKTGTKTQSETLRIY